MALRRQIVMANFGRARRRATRISIYEEMSASPSLTRGVNDIVVKVYRPRAKRASCFSAWTPPTTLYLDKDESKHLDDEIHRSAARFLEDRSKKVQRILSTTRAPRGIVRD